MRTTRRFSNFFLCLLFNLFLNFEWTIPAWILLALHFILGWSIWWFWLAIGLWLLDILIWMSFIRWAGSCRTDDPTKENKNPYSVKNKNPYSVNNQNNNNS